MKRNHTRTIFLALFVFFTLPFLTFISLGVPLLFWLWPLDTFIRAIPLYLAILIDRIFLDGGELSPEMLPVWVVLTGLVLWPLLVLAIRPELWWSRPWRKSILGYSGVVLVSTVIAAQWIFTHMGILF